MSLGDHRNHSWVDNTTNRVYTTSDGRKHNLEINVEITPRPNQSEQRTPRSNQSHQRTPRSSQTEQRTNSDYGSPSKESGYGSYGNGRDRQYSNYSYSSGSYSNGYHGSSHPGSKSDAFIDDPSYVHASGATRDGDNHILKNTVHQQNKSSRRVDNDKPVQYVMRTKTKTPGNSRSTSKLSDLREDGISSTSRIQGSYGSELTAPPGERYVDTSDPPSYSQSRTSNSRYPNGIKNQYSSEQQTQNNSKGTGNTKTKTYKVPDEKEFKFPDSDKEDDFDMDDVGEEMKGNDVYLCYLMTEDGGTVGPLRLDIDDVKIGLPSKIEMKEDEPGMRNRQTGSHGLNEFSSRSHSMLTLTIDTEQQDPDDENLYLTKRGKLTFVDLAGSEKVKDSESTDKTLVESNNINRSLLVLGNCISSLGDPKKRQGHIPYRDSKLTKLLADSLGGNGVTLMVACVTPSSHHASETINTLRYASRAKKIKTKPVVKMDPREKLILSLKREIKILRNENVYLRQQLEFPAKPKGALQKENDEKFMKFLKQGKDVGNTGPPVASNKGEAGLYEMLQEYMIENEALRSENSEMHSTKDRIKREQQLMYRENERLQKRIEALEKESRGQGGYSRPMNGPPPPQHDPYYDPPRQSPVNRPPPGPGGQQWRNANPQRQPLAEPYPVGQQNIPPNARGKQPPPAGPKRPPHRLPDNIPHRTPPNMSQDPMQNGGYHDDGYMSPRGRPLQNGPIRQESPMRYPDSRRSSQASASDSIRSMNEKLKQEIMELEGEIEHHHMVNQRNKSIYGSQTSVRSGPR